MKYSNLVFSFFILLSGCSTIKAASTEEQIELLYVKHLTKEGNLGTYTVHRVSSSRDILDQILKGATPETKSSFKIVYALPERIIDFEEFKVLFKKGVTSLAAYLVKKD